MSSYGGPWVLYPGWAADERILLSAGWEHVLRLWASPGAMARLRDDDGETWVCAIAGDDRNEEVQAVIPAESFPRGVVLETGYSAEYAQGRPPEYRRVRIERRSPGQATLEPIWESPEE